VLPQNGKHFAFKAIMLQSRSRTLRKRIVRLNEWQEDSGASLGLSIAKANIEAEGESYLRRREGGLWG
jgi:hypothetical protein